MSTGHNNVTFPRQYAATRRFSLGTPRTFTVVPSSTDGGGRVLFLRSASGDDPALSLWSLDLASGGEQLIADPQSLGADESTLSPAERARRERARESAAGIVAYSVDRSGDRAAFSLGRSLYSVDGVGTDSKVSLVVSHDGLFDPRIDPTGRRIAYVAGGALRLASLDTGTSAGPETDRELVADPDPLVSWGRADFVAAEEMGRARGFWWGPDGEHLLVNRVSDHPVGQWFIADPANPSIEPNEIRYPAAGTSNPDVALALVSADPDTTSPVSPLIDWSDGGRYEYLADVVWDAGHRPLIVRQTRDQRIVSIAELDLETLEVRERQQITDDTWVELIPGSPRPTAHGLLTVEDRAELDRRLLCLDGRPLVMEAATGSEGSIDAPGPSHVRSIVGMVGTDRVVVSGWTEPHEVHLFLVSLVDSTIRPLTTEPGVHAGSVKGTVLVTTSSSPDRSGATTMVTDLDDAAAPHPIRTNSATPVLGASVRFERLGERSLPTAILLPHDHDGASPLPVLLDPYGGPHAQRVLATHDAHLVSQWFADQGFAVLVTDGSGTPGRGPAAEREVWGDLAQPVLDDQIAALDAAADLMPFLDLDRVGIRGWSFGGYLAALAVLRRPDRFHAAVAGAPVTTWHLYDTHYTERYLGHPDTHDDHYRRSDLLVDVAEAGDRAERPLLIIHGLADDNVVAAHTLRLSSALLAAGRSHTVLPLSGVTHMTPQEVVAENLLHLQRDFLLQNLGDES